MLTTLEPWQAHPFQRTGDISPVVRLHRAAAAGLPVGTIKHGGVRRPYADYLVHLGLGEVRGGRIYATQQSLPFMNGVDQ